MQLIFKEPEIFDYFNKPVVIIYLYVTFKYYSNLNNS